VVLAACSDDRGDETTSSEADADIATSSADDDTADATDAENAMVDQAPAGPATVSVDGQGIAYVEVLAGSCTISDDAITYGFAAAPNPDGEGVIGYYPAPVDVGDARSAAPADPARFV
jgi:hypothetical protein